MADKRTKTKVNIIFGNIESTLGFSCETVFGYKRRIRVTKKSCNQKQKRVDGQGGAPALMLHRPAAVGSLDMY